MNRTAHLLLERSEKMLKQDPNNGPVLGCAKVDPDLTAIRDHPRFKAMLKKAEERLGRASTQP